MAGGRTLGPHAHVRHFASPALLRGQPLILNPNGVLQHLSELERKGYLKRSGGKSRMLTLTEKKSDETIPLKGKIE